MPLSLFPAGSDSLAKRHVTPDRFARLSELETHTGFTLNRAIASGRAHGDSSIGIYAGDAETYDLFQEVMEPIILDYHKITAPIAHPAPIPANAFGTLGLENPDPENEFIRSTRIRVARNLADIPFPPHISAAQRREVKEMVTRAVQNFPAELQGQFFEMDPWDSREIQAEFRKGNAFPKGDRFMEDAGINREFPRNRGVFKSRDNRALIWVNEEDHLRVISLEPGGNIQSVFQRLGRMLERLSRELSFAHHPQLGHLASCPTNIGTAMRAGVHICLPGLESQPEQLHAIAGAHHLQIRGTAGEKTAVHGSVFDISNKHRLGIDEGKIVHTLHKGVTALITAEKQIQKTA
ncbi:MAG: arginine kinase [Desulfobacterales bacterium]|nr:arginine kinase [Desulfobacterales bacterium]